jgi:hypothetical protein
MGNSLRHLVLFLAAAALTLAPGLVYSQAAPSVVPVNISPVGPVSGGLQTMATYQATGAGAANGYYTRPVLVSNNTLGGLANGLARRAAPVAAFTAAVAAAGWAIDELTKQVNASPASGGAQIPVGSIYYHYQGNYFSTQGGLASYILQLHNANSPSHQATHIEFTNDVGQIGTLTMKARPWDSSYAGHRLANAPDNLYEPVTPAVPATVAQLSDLIKNNPSLWNPALRNPDGSVNRNPDVMNEADALRDQLSDPQATPQPDPAAEWDSGQQGGDPQNSPTSLEFPTFCDWASVVCSFIDWVKGTEDFGPDAELPVTEIPVTPSTWTSGLGGGACPANKSLNLSVWSGSVSFQPVCDLAGYIRPLLILSALLIGAFIISGANKQNV